MPGHSTYGLGTCQEDERNRDKGIMEAFTAFDVDGDGFLSKQEMDRLLKIMGLELNDEELDECIAIADFNKDGKIDYKGTGFSVL